MALLETAGTVAVGFAAGRVAINAVTAATGTALRPVAKVIVRGVLLVSDGVGSIVSSPVAHRASRSPAPRPEHRTRRTRRHAVRRPGARRRRAS